jgi:hypothetical protein
MRRILNLKIQATGFKAPNFKIQKTNKSQTPILNDQTCQIPNYKHQITNNFQIPMSNDCKKIIKTWVI